MNCSRSIEARMRSASTAVPRRWYPGAGCEFLAADARHRVHVASQFLHDMRDHDECFVAGLMAVVIVDFLEVINIEQESRKCPTHSAAPSPAPWRRFRKRRAGS